ncbi:hypothetical protein VOLCADRAFT_101544, partial [Volvox carteri f. nagariensis]
CCRFDGRKPAICWECLWECLWDYMDQNPMPHTMRFERTRGNLTALAGRRLNHSATGQDALFMICKLTNNPQEACIILNDLTAVRGSLVRQGKFKPYGERLAVEFVH